MLILAAVCGIWICSQMKTLPQPRLPEGRHLPTTVLAPLRPAAAPSHQPIDTRGCPPHPYFSPYPYPPAPPAKLNIGKYIAAGLCLAYIISPIDFIPDVLPLVGWGDDAVAALVGLGSLLSR
ncbi:YkvA family protein [Paludisphaera borealis]|uniref:DUF1232 domain-containing protein n=1 Tax=Paludisphaera borealis TaxID=1387353 RepID=A0A1U7CIA5_9BACT|nr:YkvA family protein [Paludisphaera borealis]APW58636.1 hypothetical protein BSF38_00034 [Paludisphaera borealis]